MTRFASLKLLADENVSPRVVAFLRQQKIDVLDVKEMNWHGRTDDFLLQKAFAACRFILTHDADFGTLAIKEEKPCFGILFLRLKSPGATNVIRTLEKLLTVQPVLLPGSLVVIDETRFRIRLPITHDSKKVSEPAAPYKTAKKPKSSHKTSKPQSEPRLCGSA